MLGCGKASPINSPSQSTSGGDTTGPQVTKTFPSSGLTILTVTPSVSATFNEDIDPSTINSKTFIITSNKGSVTGDITYDATSKTAYYQVTGSMEYSSTYTAILSHDIKDLSGNRLGSSKSELGVAYTFSFKTIDKWVEATPEAFTPGRRNHATVSHNGKLYVIGGWNDATHSRLNDVWESADGKVWKRLVENAPFDARSDHAAISHNGKLYVVGGVRETVNPLDSPWVDDVWSSYDGKNWTQVTTSAGFGGRTDHTLLSYNGYLWVMAGMASGSLKNDVWSSSDGKIWSQVTPEAQFSKRAFHAGVVHDNKMWILGGYDGGTSNKNDVWSSRDGKTWSLVNTNAAFGERTYHEVLSYDNKLWVIAGFRGSQYTNDIWTSSDGISWDSSTTGADIPPRVYHSGAVLNNRMYITGGDALLSNGTLMLDSNDVWMYP